MTSLGLQSLHGKKVDGLLFCRKAYLLFSRVRREKNGISRLRMRKSIVEKRLIEEILPITRYIQLKYRAGKTFRVKWLNGNQNYDAVIYRTKTVAETNNLPTTCHVEVTCAMHAKDFLFREHINNGNTVFGLDGLERDRKTKEIKSVPTVRIGRTFVRKFSDIVINRINEKSRKNYPNNTILIVECNLDTLYDEDEWNEMLALVKENIKQHSFAEIFLFSSILDHHTTIFPHH